MPGASPDVDTLLFALQTLGPGSVDVREPLLKALKPALGRAKTDGLVAERKEKRDAFTPQGKPKYTKAGKRSQETVTLVELTDSGTAHLAERLGAATASAALDTLDRSVGAALHTFFERERETLLAAVRQQVQAHLGGNGATTPRNGGNGGADGRTATPTTTATATAHDLDADLRTAWNLLRYYPEALGNYVEIPRLYHEVRKRHRDLTVPRFHDRLRELARERVVGFSYANSPANVPEPDLGFRERDQFVYYLAFRDGEGRS